MKRARWVLVVLVLAGMGCRIGQYVWNRSYWRDEAFLVLNVVEKDARALLGPLDAVPGAPQAAPPLFLLVQRGLVVGVGESEFVLRLVPLVLGCASVGLFGLLAWRVLPPWPAVVVVGVFAFSDPLIWYAAEAKQYAGDVFVATVLILLAIWDRRRWDELRRLGHVGLAAIVLMWLSHPTVFVFGALSLALLPGIVRRGWKQPAGWAGVNALVVLSFLLLFALSIQVQQSPVLREYWAEGFPDYSRVLMLPVWFIAETIEIFERVYAPMGVVLLALTIAGAAGCWRDGRREMLIICLGPLGLLLLAAMVHQYPYEGSRLTIFLAPGILLMAGAGIDQLARRIEPELRRKIIWFLAGVMVAYGAGICAYHAVVPRHRGHIRPYVRYVQERRQEGEGVLVFERKTHEFLCYWRRPGERVWLEVSTLPADVPDRFWIVTSYSSRARGLREMEPLLRQADDVARRVESEVGAGGAAFLYDRNDPAHAATAGRPTYALAGQFRCTDQ